MVRIAHTGDLHLPEGPRFADVLAAIDALIADGEAEGVRLWIVFGDLTGTTVPHRATILEQNALDQRFQRMAQTAPVILGYGNHDSPGDLDGYGRLAAPHPIIVFAEPGMVDVAGVRVLAFPFPHKRTWLAKHADLPLEQQNLAIRDDLAALFATWRPAVAEAHQAGMPCILVAHASFDHSAFAGGEVIAPGQEITLPVEGLQALGCDYVGSCHIHLCQEMSPGIWHPGSPSRSNFGEQDQKGYLVVDVEVGQFPQVYRRLTPVRRFVTIEAAWVVDEAGGRFEYGAELGDLSTAEVRVRVALPEDAAASCPTDDLKRQLAERGAVAVQLERRILPKTRVRSEEITHARTVPEKLDAYWGTLGTAAPSPDQRARALDKLPTLEEVQDATAHVAA